VSWNHWFANKNIGIRPEIRVDQDLDGETPFDSGTKKSQVMGQLDLVTRF